MKNLLLVAALAASALFAQTPAREAWAVDRSGGIYRLTNGQWNVMPGILIWVSVGADGSVWGVNPGLGIFRWTGNDWVQIPGSLSQISVGNAQTIWGVNAIGEIWRRVGDSWELVPVPKRMMHVSASSDGAVWALDVDTGIWRRNGNDWQAIGGLLRQISVGNAQTVWGVSQGGEVWRFNAAGGWDKMPQLLSQVSVGPDGEVWGVLLDGQLVRWTGSTWAPLNRTFAQVSVGTPGAGATPAGQKAEENSTAFTFNGAWTPATNASASGGAYTTSNTAGSSVTFSATGNNFVLYRRVDPTGGYADVTVDGKNLGRLTFYFPEVRWQVPAAIDGLGDGPHTIVLTVSATRPANSQGSNVYFDSVENPAPASLGPNDAQRTAVARTNFYRSIAGLPPARHNLALGLAATAHGKYLTDVDFIGRGSSPHVETFGASPNFSGQQPSDRAALFGFLGGVAEDVSNNPDPNAFVDGWVGGVYHREPFFAYSYTEIGFGAGASGSAIDFASRVSDPIRPATPTTTTFPADNQTNIWLNYGGGDGPNNVQTGNIGYPISIDIAYPINATAGSGTRVPTTGTLTDAAGNNVAVTIADRTTDTQLTGYFMIPNQPLAPATTYTARMTGTDGLNNRFDKTWKFTTVGLNGINNVRASIGSNTYIYSINWDMPTGGVTSQLEYGPTTAYGTVIPGELFPGRQTTFRALVPGLLTTPVTHYRVTSRDAQGNIFASPDYTLTVDKTLPPATTAFVTASPDTDSVSIRWETAGLVASSRIEYGLDANYGSVEQGSPFTGYPTWFNVYISDLTPATTYHYRIVTTDLQGNTVTTPDATFTTN